MPAPLTRAVAALSLLLLALPVAAAPFRLVTTDLEPQLVPNSVMDLASSLGYFQREGVDVELVRVQQTPSAVAALQAGEGEMANISVDAALQLVARDQMQLKAVVSPNKSLPFLIAAKDDIASVDDLAGRSFGIGRVGSLDYSLSSKVLASKGVDTGKLDFVAIGQPNVRAQALAAGQIDATTMSVGVWLALPDKHGLHVLVDPDAYFAAAPVLNKVNVVPDAVLQARHDDVEKVVRALVKASRDFAQKPALWVDAMAAARPDVDRQTLETLAKSFVSAWSVNGGLNRAQVDATVDWTYATPDFAGLRKVGFDEWVDLTPITDVLKAEGVAPGDDQPGF
ncbi:MAG: ABC transporter substrate-binding protein [Amaricoccus sp.]|uniref:ABC transporter substrate-binding protein n=1 Tax=Amaricoccus sp. TaxID=1872485 RepID=UPI0039E30F6D